MQRYIGNDIPLKLPEKVPTGKLARQVIDALALHHLIRERCIDDLRDVVGKIAKPISERERRGEKISYEEYAELGHATDPYNEWLDEIVIPAVDLRFFGNKEKWQKRLDSYKWHVTI